MKNNLPLGFNPSPFGDDNIPPKITPPPEELVNMLKNLLNETSPPPKHNFVPVMFVAQSKSQKPKGEYDVFHAEKLTRENKETILAFAFDWLKERGLFPPTVEKNWWIENVFKQRFEMFLLP